MWHRIKAILAGHQRTEASASQLRMGFALSARLFEPQMESQYHLRNYRHGDEEEWVAVLSTGLGEWDRGELDGVIAGARGPMPLDGAFFVTHRDRIVGAVCTLLRYGDQGEHAELGWLAVDPSHQGHGLGLQLTRAVLEYSRELGHTYAFLLTDDFRLPAIKTYLKAGFKPEITDSTQPERWTLLYRALGVEDPNAPLHDAPLVDDRM